ncbi:hypothetical protein C0J52_09455 [Blattella germanica]|nr:hypothetical protein C0J52_09455 [Blattella germanica]
MDVRLEWLTKEFLETILNSSAENRLRVESFVVQRASAEGDNYSSDIYRATMQILKEDQREMASLIIKVELSNNQAVKNILEKASPERHYPPYGAKCYYASNETPMSVIVLEDLKEQGFILAEPSDGLDLKHCKLAIQTLATYHAASAVLNALEPEKIAPFKTSLISEDIRGKIESIFIPIVKTLAEEAENWPGCEGYVVNKLNGLASSVFDYMLDCVKTNDDEFNVLCHEDIWLNNIMFRYAGEANAVSEVRFLDLQMYHWTSPAVDLLYFVNANASLDVVANYKQIVDEYYNVLSETFKDLGHVHLCPEKKDIYSQLEKRCKFGVIYGIISRLFIFSNRNEVPDMENYIRETGRAPFTNRYREQMKTILPLFQQWGWL